MLTAAPEVPPDRILHREWKAFKPHLPKSSSLPAFQLAPRDRPRFLCVQCGFANFHNIPMCVWCAIPASQACVRAFECTMPRTRTLSAPPRVFWEPNEFTVTRRDSGASASTRLDGVFDSRAGAGGGGNRRSHTMMPPPPSGLVQGHKRSHSQPNALRLGHPARPYYSAIRKDASSFSQRPAFTLDQRAPRPRPPPIALPPPVSQSEFCLIPVSIGDSDDSDLEAPAPAFSFVSPDAPERLFTQRTLSARISRTLTSPVVALHAMSKAAEMRGELAALVRGASSSIEPEDRDQDDGEVEGLLAMRLRKLRGSLKGLVRRR